MKTLGSELVYSTKVNIKSIINYSFNTARATGGTAKYGLPNITFE